METPDSSWLCCRVRQCPECGSVHGRAKVDTAGTQSSVKVPVTCDRVFLVTGTELLIQFKGKCQRCTRKSCLTAVEACGEENRQEAKQTPPQPVPHASSHLELCASFLTWSLLGLSPFSCPLGAITEPSVWWWPAPTPFLTPVLEPTSTWRCSTTVSLTVSHLVPHAGSGPSPTEQGAWRAHLDPAHVCTHPWGWAQTDASRLAPTFDTFFSQTLATSGGCFPTQMCPLL